MIALEALASLAKVFAQVPERRKRRGIRHPLHGILCLTFLGMLGRIRKMEVLIRWAKVHWDQLREPLGFDRDQPPHPTTISRTLAKCDLVAFGEALLQWVQQFVPDEPLAAAVDGKTSCQGMDDEGHPLQLLTVMVHDLKIVLKEWSVRGEKTNEPNVFKNHLEELCLIFPTLKLFTGDAIFTQRPLAEEIIDQGRDYLLQIKGNQPDIQEAAQYALGGAHEKPPAAETVEKRGFIPIAAGCG
jgi:hypothetical protein